MVDSPRDMIEGLEQLPERVAAVERKVDVLSTRVDALSAREEEHYQQTAAAFAEQRSYTDTGFARVETTLGRLERKLDGFIDTQTRTNDIAERRLRRLEARG